MFGSWAAVPFCVVARAMTVVFPAQIEPIRTAIQIGSRRIAFPLNTVISLTCLPDAPLCVLRIAQVIGTEGDARTDDPTPRASVMLRRIRARHKPGVESLRLKDLMAAFIADNYHRLNGGGD